MEIISAKLITSLDLHFYEVLFSDGTTDHFPSVTTILQAYPQPHLSEWKGNVGNFFAEMAKNRGAARGSRIHNAVEKMLNGAVIIYDNGLGSISQSELEFYKAHYETVIMTDQLEYNEIYRIKQLFELWHPKILLTESKVYNIKERYAGTTDLVLFIEKSSWNYNGTSYKIPKTGIYVADVKSGSVISDSAHYQTAAYKEALDEMGVLSTIMPGEEFAGTIILHTNSKTMKGIEGLSIKVRDEYEVLDDYQGFKDVYSVYKRTMSNKPKIWQMPNALIYKK